MPKLCYINKRFSIDSLALIEMANSIIEEYAEQGYLLTLRQLYYQFVSRGKIENSQKSYKRLGSIINDARLAGHIDWESVTDRTRNLQKNSHWRTPSGIIESAAKSYRIDLWDDQPRRVEVWIEKDALIGVIEDTCRDLDVPFFSCRGYTSQSEMWNAAMRLGKYREKSGQIPLVVHLGDHDPSGVDMTRDIFDRLELLSNGFIEVSRIALNFDQVEQYNPPPNPAKLTDSRCEAYIQRHGRESWELDALEPQVINDLIRKHIEAVIDWDLFDDAQERQKEQREQLQMVSDRWAEIVNLLEGEE